MALNFPDSPSLNQVYTDSVSGFSYQWDGYVWQSYTPSSVNNILILDDISGSFNGSDITFNLTEFTTPVFPKNPQQLRVTLGGIVQEPGTDYTVAGSTISFTTPPSFGIDCSIVSLGPALVSESPSSGNLFVRQEYNPTGVQTSFSVTANYSPGYLEIYRNGVKLVDGTDFTATDGSNFDLTVPAQNGDILEAITYRETSLYTLGAVVNDLTVLGNANVVGITTLGGNVKVGVGTTALIVEGDARITGILTVGSSSVTINGITDQVNIGSGVTITSNHIVVSGIVTAASFFGDLNGDINSTGISTFSTINVGVISATSFVGDGSGLTGAGSTVFDDTSTNATFYPVITQTTSGIITSSNVSTTKLTFNPSTGVLSSTQVNDAAGNVRVLTNNAKGTSYILVAGDVGELINITTGGVTVPSGVFSAGDNVTIYNNSANPQTITQGSGVTLRLVGTTSTGNRSLDQRGLATVLCVASNEFVISGGGLS
jgi:hypothetical protein